MRTGQNQIDMDHERDRLLELRHQRLDRVDQRDGIGARGLLDRDALGREIVEPSADTGVLHRVDGLADVLEPHWRAVAIGDDQFPYAAASKSWSLVSIATNSCCPSIAPLGRLTVAAASALRTSSRPMPCAASAAGLTCTRAA